MPTYVHGFRSLMAELPDNTLCVYSFSKYFGATGWRLAVISLHEDNIYDRMIAALPDDKKAALAKRYSSIMLDPSKMKFIDRMVADSRQVALESYIRTFPATADTDVFCLLLSPYWIPRTCISPDDRHHSRPPSYSLEKFRFHIARRSSPCRLLQRD